MVRERNRHQIEIGRPLDSLPASAQLEPVARSEILLSELDVLLLNTVARPMRTRGATASSGIAPVRTGIHSVHAVEPTRIAQTRCLLRWRW